MAHPVFLPNERAHPADMDVVAYAVEHYGQAALLAVYPNQNTATSALPRFRRHIAGGRSPRTRRLKVTGRKVDGVTGVFAYLTDEQLSGLVDHFDYIDRSDVIEAARTIAGGAHGERK